MTKKILCLKQAAIGRDEIASGQQHHVARHQICYRKLLGMAITQYRSTYCYSLLQLFCGATGPVFLNGIQRYAHQHDGPDDHESGDFAGQRGHSAGSQENHYQRILEVVQVLDDQQLFAMGTQRVIAELLDSRTRFPLAQASRKCPHL